MKTVLPRQEFQDALSAITSLTGGRTTKPILACVKITATRKLVELSATDGEAALRVEIPALSTAKEGAVVVAADRLLAIVREMTDVELALEADERHCSIKGEGSDFRIYVMNPADFPPIPEFDGEGDLVVDGGLLRRMIAMTLYAAARETSRYAINGVLWQKVGKKLFLVATDGRRLARAGGDISAASSGDFEAIVPAKALNVFERVFVAPKSDEDWRVDIKVAPNQILLRSGARLLATVLVEGHFPSYKEVIPESSDKCAGIRREEFIAAVRKAALLTTEDSRAVRLSFQKQQLVLTSSAPDQGDARVQVAIGFEGSPIDIGFNPVFINDALRAAPFETVFFEMSESFKPGVIRGEDKNEFLYVVMPVSLQN